MKLDLNLIDKKAKTIVIGVSAGPDSMALLHYLHNNTNYNIVCAHVNHNVRKESAIEQEFLEQYCFDNNIIFECYKINEYKENNFENEARKIRYNFYYSILNKYNSNYLLLGHHADDLIETIFMKISRGSNLEGYAGIKKINKYNDYYIIRPLLDYTKDEILKYNEKFNVKYFIDKSNTNDDYTRNRYRKYILPFLKKEDVDIHKKFIQYSNTLLEYDNYIKKETKKLVNEVYVNNKLNIENFNDIDSFMQKNILFYILNNLYENNSNIVKNKHIVSIISICDNKNNNLQISLPHSFIAIKEYNELKFEKVNTVNEYKKELTNEVIIENFIIKKIDFSESNGNNICRLNSKNIKLPLYIRNKKDGDKIEVLGLNGHKLISDIFIENKVPSNKRKSYPLLVDSNDNILWVPNLKKSKFNTKNHEFCDIILEYCEKEEKNEYK